MPKYTRLLSGRCGQLALASLTATLAMGLSHHAMADGCTPPEADLTEGATVNCTGATNTPYWASGSTATAIDGVTIINSGDFSIGSVSAATQAVNLSGSDTTFKNESGATLSITDTDATKSRTVIGIQSSSSFDGVEFENVSVLNEKSATIAATTAGSGSARGIYAGEDIESLRVENSGTISATRSSSFAALQAPLKRSNGNAITIVSDGNGGFIPTTSGTSTPSNVIQAKIGSGSFLNLGDVSAIGSDDDVEEMSITNHSGGNITGTGDFAYGLYMRAGDFTINNEKGATISSTGGAFGNVAISGHAEGNATLNNAGTITGDVQFLDANALKLQAYRALPDQFQFFDGTAQTPDSGKDFIILDQVGAATAKSPTPNPASSMATSIWAAANISLRTSVKSEMFSLIRRRQSVSAKMDSAAMLAIENLQWKIPGRPAT